MFKRSTAVWLIPIFFVSGIAVAQNAAPTTEAAQASRLQYRSAFEGYRPYTDDKLLNWKEANDTTGRIGGWRVYAKEARQPDVKPSTHDMSKMPAAKPGGEKQ